MWRGDLREIDEHVVSVAAWIESWGLTIRYPAARDELELLEHADGSVSFEIRAELAGPAGVRARFEVRERFAPTGAASGLFERRGYEYELIDLERDFRRAFHLHDPEWFQRHFLVVVHEHCERPIGQAGCRHHAGFPVRDAWEGLGLLWAAWMNEPPECAELRCLE